MGLGNSKQLFVDAIIMNNIIEVERLIPYINKDELLEYGHYFTNQESFIPIRKIPTNYRHPIDMAIDFYSKGNPEILKLLLKHNFTIPHDWSVNLSNDIFLEIYRLEIPIYDPKTLLKVLEFKYDVLLEQTIQRINYTIFDNYINNISKHTNNFNFESIIKELIYDYDICNNLLATTTVYDYLRANNKVNIPIFNYKSFLLLCAELGDVACLKYCMEEPSTNINIRDSNGNNVFLCACMNFEGSEIIKYLISKNYEYITSENILGETAFDVINCAESVRVLKINYMITPTDKNINNLIVKNQWSLKDVLKVFIEFGDKFHRQTFNKLSDKIKYKLVNSGDVKFAD